MKKIAFQADDFGANPETDEAILQTLENGVIKNVGLLVCSEFVEDSAKELNKIKNCDIGLHLCITSGGSKITTDPFRKNRNSTLMIEVPFSQHLSTFLTNKSFFCRNHERSGGLMHLMLKLGLQPSYADCHMGFGWLHEPGNNAFKLDSVLNDYFRKQGIYIQIMQSAEWAEPNRSY